MRLAQPARRAGVILVLTILLSTLHSPLTAPAHAEDESAPLLTIAKSSLLGGLVGLVLGGVTALVVDSDKRDDSVRWGIVLGTFGGFAYGIYAVSRPSEDDDFFGARHSDPEAWAWQRPLPGQTRLARFAGLNEDRGTRTSVPDPFRVQPVELATLD